MKKSNLFLGILYLIVGILCLLAAIFFKTIFQSLLCGFAGAFIIPGITMCYKYFYWSKPENKEKYNEKIESEYIELHDELKEQLRNKSGRYAYIANLIILLFSIIIFSILSFLYASIDIKYIVVFLSGLLVFQYILGIIIYKKLLKNF